MDIKKYIGMEKNQDKKNIFRIQKSKNVGFFSLNKNEKFKK